MKQSCPKCVEKGGDFDKDNLRTHPDGGLHCYACGYTVPSEAYKIANPKKGYVVGQPVETPVNETQSSSTRDLFTDGIYESIPERGLTEEYCRKYQYQTGLIHGKSVHIANYVNLDGDIVSQKIRTEVDKTFEWRKNSPTKLLFGFNLLPKDLETLYIVEGEIDCVYFNQMLNQHGLYATTIYSGAGPQGKKDIEQALPALEKLKKVVFLFDNDKEFNPPATVGNDCALECAALLTPGKAFVCTLAGAKDVNDYHRKGLESSLLDDVKKIVPYQPSCIRKPSREQLLTSEASGWSMRLPVMSRHIKGLKRKRLNLWLAGPKIGKSSILKKIVKDAIDDHPDVIALVAHLEEPLEETGQSFIALDNQIPWHEFTEDVSLISKENFEASYTKYIDSDRLTFLDAAFCDLKGETIIHAIRHMIISKGCNLIVLDHISMITYDSQGESSERRDIDILLKKLKKLAVDMNVCINVVCHLKRPDQGKAWNEGREVKSDSARGSGGFEQLCDLMLGLERNMLDEREKTKTYTKILLNRITGWTGYTDDLYYNEKTGCSEVLSDLFNEDQT